MRTASTRETGVIQRPGYLRAATVRAMVTPATTATPPTCSALRKPNDAQPTALCTHYPGCRSPSRRFRGTVWVAKLEASAGRLRRKMKMRMIRKAFFLQQGRGVDGEPHSCRSPAGAQHAAKEPHGVAATTRLHDRALAALRHVQGRRVSSTARRVTGRKRFSPKVLAALKWARAARRRQRPGKTTQPAAS